MNSNGHSSIHFNISYDEGENPNTIRDIVYSLNRMGVNFQHTQHPIVPSFPMKISELDTMKMIKLESEVVDPTNPLYTDKAYLKRRNELENLNSVYKMGDPITRLDYLQSEKDTWAYIWDRIMPAINENGCKAFLKNMEFFKKAGIFRRDDIPQLCELNDYLIKKTNWRIKPVNGIISQREYLNCLAFRTFPSTQYIRHHDSKEYTPEPDICHEFFGHMAMFSDPMVIIFLVKKDL